MPRAVPRALPCPASFAEAVCPLRTLSARLERIRPRGLGRRAGAASLDWLGSPSLSSWELEDCVQGRCPDERPRIRPDALPAQAPLVELWPLRPECSRGRRPRICPGTTAPALHNRAG